MGAKTDLNSKKIAGLRPFLFVLLVISFLSWTSAHADVFSRSPELSKVIKVLHDKSIFNINDPLRAAMSLRSLAADIGARTDLIPTYVGEDIFAVAGKQTLSLMLPARPVWVRVEDQSITAELQRELDSPGSSESLTAILVLNRPLSIDELAKIMESGVRVLERIPGGLLIRTDGPRILRIAGEPYAHWIGEFVEAYKYSRDERVSSLDQYGVRYFGGFDEEYRRDLDAIGVTVEGAEEGLKRIFVRCGEHALDKLVKLEWVAAIYPTEVPEIASPVDLPRQCPSRLRLLDH